MILISPKMSGSGVVELKTDAEVPIAKHKGHPSLDKYKLQRCNYMVNALGIIRPGLGWLT